MLENNYFKTVHYLILSQTTIRHIPPLTIQPHPPLSSSPRRRPWHYSRPRIQICHPVFVPESIRDPRIIPVKKCIWVCSVFVHGQLSVVGDMEIDEKCVFADIWWWEKSSKSWFWKDKNTETIIYTDIMFTTTSLINTHHYPRNCDMVEVVQYGNFDKEHKQVQINGCCKVAEEWLI